MSNHGGARPGGGRPKGSQNKLSKEFAEKVDAACKKHNVDLIGGLVELCKDDSKEIQLKARQTLLPYRYPKLRQVEYSFDEDTKVPVFQLIVEKEKNDE